MIDSEIRTATGDAAYLRVDRLGVFVFFSLGHLGHSAWRSDCCMLVISFFIAQHKAKYRDLLVFFCVWLRSSFVVDLWLE